MNEEINSPYVSSESPPLAPGKLTDDRMAMGILFLTLTLTCSQWKCSDFVVAGFVYILINWISGIRSSGLIS